MWAATSTPMKAIKTEGQTVVLRRRTNLLLVAAMIHLHRIISRMVLNPYVTPQTHMPGTFLLVAGKFPRLTSGAWAVLPLPRGTNYTPSMTLKRVHTMAQPMKKYTGRQPALRGESHMSCELRCHTKRVLYMIRSRSRSRETHPCDTYVLRMYTAIHTHHTGEFSRDV